MSEYLRSANEITTVPFVEIFNEFERRMKSRPGVPPSRRSMNNSWALCESPLSANASQLVSNRTKLRYPRSEPTVTASRSREV